MLYPNLAASLFRLLYTLYLVCFVATTVLAQSQLTFDTSKVYTLADQYPLQSLVAKTSILLEGAAELKIEDLLSQPAIRDAFIPLGKETVEGEGKQVAWLRVRIYAEMPIEHWWLLLRRNTPMFDYLANHDRVEVYFVRNSRIVKKSSSGTLVPASEKEVDLPPTINAVPIHLPEGSLTDIYIRVEDQRAVFPHIELRNPDFPLSFAEEKPMISSLELSGHISAIIAIYTLLFFFYTRDLSYLYLFGMLVFLFLHYYQLHMFMPFIQWFIPEHPHWNEAAWVILTHGSYAFFLQFGRTFTGLKQISPFWDKAMLWGVWFTLLTMLAKIVLWGVQEDIYYQVGEYITLINFLVLLFITARLAWFKNTLVRYFVFGGAWLFFFSVLGILWQNQIIPFFTLPNPWQVAQYGFMLIYAFALARKIQISEQARSEVEKVRAIDAVKSRFFANISHEFRTPLSLILGPINQSLENIPASEAVENETEIPVKGRYLKLMKRHTIRLQTLVDQILDLSKLDQGKMRLEVAAGGMIQFIRSLVYSFESMAERKHIHFSTYFPAELEEAYFDQEKMQVILTNLLSNAFKFTPEHGEVAVRVEEEQGKISIQISDSGNGMSRGEATKIFDRFYQVEGTEDQGTGIGLALVKELVDLYRGQIRVDSTEGEGTTFKLRLPYEEKDFQAEEIKQTSNPPSAIAAPGAELFEDFVFEQNNADKDRPQLLIVEDNPDLRYYIADQLQAHFQIITAVNGEEGLEKAKIRLPDIIVSDVMMPKMNGIELCEKLKTDVKTSHIPVILLTAKAGQDAKITGLQTGADDYLTKPFDGRELLVRANNLVAQRAKMRELFAGELKIRPSEVTLNSMDENFLRQVMGEIEKNMDNEYYTVEDLANAVSFSRSQLNRKLKGLTGKSPNQLIREFRLTRAKELLEQQSATISEIAYQVGYSSLSYFTKCYKDTFGITPSETA